MIRHLVSFALDSDRPDDVAFKVAVMIVLAPVVAVIVVADVVERAVRRMS